MRRHLTVWATTFLVGCGVLGCSSDATRSVSTSSDATSTRRETLGSSQRATAMLASARRSFGFATHAKSVRGHIATSRSALPAGSASFALDGGRIVPRFAPGVSRSTEVSVGGTADQPTEIREASSAFASLVTLRGSAPVRGEAADGYVVYPSAYLGEADVLSRPSADGVEDFVLFGRRPAEQKLRYSIALGGSIASLRLVANSLELLDATGAPRLRMQSPWAVDEAGHRVNVVVSVTDCAVDTDPRAPWGRPIRRAGSPACTIELSWDAPSYPLLVDPTWTSSGNTSAYHFQALSTLLANGRVLAAGGLDNTFTPHATAELYDPETRTWATTGSLGTARAWASGTLLANGTVLAAGGEDGTALSIGTAETYDPTSGMWTATGALSAAREGHAAYVLANGRVLVAGGYQGTANATASLGTTDIYDPVAGTWTPGGSMAAARSEFASVAFANGRIFVAGGIDYGTNMGLGSAEIYDPGTNAWSPAGTMAALRHGAAASLLGNGQVLVSGGDPGDLHAVATTELYDPTTNGWTNGVSMTTARTGHIAKTLPGGRQMVIGGFDFQTSVATPEVFTETPGSWASHPAMTAGTDGHFAVTLPDSRIVVGGGESGGTYSTASQLALQGDATTDKPTYATGENIVLTYAGLPATGSDWLALAPEGSQPGTYSAWTYAATSNGSYTFPGTLGAGTYRARMFYYNGYMLIGQSATTFTITGAAATVTTNATTYTTNDPIMVSWTGLAGSTTDWISIASSGSSDYAFIRWVYTGGTVNGSTTFAALQPGTYVARSYNYNNYVKVAESVPFTIGGAGSTTVTNDNTAYTTAQSAVVTFGGMLGSATDWISIAPQGSSATTFSTYRYTGGVTSGSVTIPLAGLTPGTYVSRAYFNDGYTIQAESAAFTLSP